MFVEQGFLYDVYLFDWSRIARIDIETAWSFFHDSFLEILNKHAPMQKFRTKGQGNPWFTAELSCLLHERNVAWAKARKSGSEADWLLFRQLYQCLYFSLQEIQVRVLSNCYYNSSGKQLNPYLHLKIHMIYHPV